MYKYLKQDPITLAAETLVVLALTASSPHEERVVDQSQPQSGPDTLGRSQQPRQPTDGPYSTFWVRVPSVHPSQAHRDEASRVEAMVLSKIGKSPANPFDVPR